MGWHWNEESGHRVPTNRRERLAELASGRPARVLVVAVGLSIWAWGIARLVSGSYYGGGGLVFIGGLLLLVAAGGGWWRFKAALAEWLGGGG